MKGSPPPYDTAQHENSTVRRHNNFESPPRRLGNLAPRAILGSAKSYFFGKAQVRVALAILGFLEVPILDTGFRWFYMAVTPGLRPI
jgi:hypothetical protein